MDDFYNLSGGGFKTGVYIHDTTTTDFYVSLDGGKSIAYSENLGGSSFCVNPFGEILIFRAMGDWTPVILKPDGNGGLKQIILETISASLSITSMTSAADGTFYFCMHYAVDPTYYNQLWKLERGADRAVQFSYLSGFPTTPPVSSILAIDFNGTKRFFAQDMSSAPFNLYYSADGGQNFNICNFDFDLDALITNIAFSDGDLYILAGQNIFKSSDKGLNFFQFYSTTIAIDAMAVDNKGILYKSEGASFSYKKPDDLWRYTGFINAATVTGLAVDSSGLLYILTSTDGLFLSDDKGMSFDPAPNMPAGTKLQVVEYQE
jgi:hypothetical protein